MVLVRFASALAAASLLLTAAAQTTTSTTTVIKNPITTPTVTVPASALVDIGCFATPTPLENHGPYKFQSAGNCQLVCLSLGKAVMGLSDGSNCWCGDKIPAESWQVDNSTCDTSCPGSDNLKCGGPNKLWIVLTGSSLNRVEYYEPLSSSSSSTTATKTSTTATSISATAVTTPSASASTTPKVDSKPNTVGIAVGVVVGLVGLCAIIVGVWFLMRRRRQKQAEENYRRNAANVTDFVSGGKLHTSNSSMNDSRLDPSFVSRRQSNGSLADNEDYSRRILKVTNV